MRGLGQTIGWLFTVIGGGASILATIAGVLWLADRAFDAYLPYVVAAAVWIALFAFIGGWTVGGRHGERAKRRATEIQAEAGEQMKVADTALARAIEDQRLAAKAIKAARGQQAAARSKCMVKEVELVHQTRELPLQSRLQAAVTFCNYPDENWQSFEERRDAILLKRLKAWEGARRFGHRLLPVVEGQNGLCGDPAKDRNGKGCGCYLYAFPPTAVHLDHIVPQSRGGTDGS